MLKFTLKVTPEMKTISFQILEMDNSLRNKGVIYSNRMSGWSVCSAGGPDINEKMIFLRGSARSFDDYHSTTDYGYFNDAMFKNFVEQLFQTFIEWGNTVNKKLYYEPLTEIYYYGD